MASNMSKDGDDSRDSGEASEDKKDGKAGNSDDPEREAAKQALMFPSMASETNDPIRIKCREMLGKALEMSRECTFFF